MKTLSRTFAVLAAALVSFASCQKEMSFDSNKQTHKVSFTAEQMTTKTSATVNGTEVKYSWTAGDTDNFTVYEVVDGTYTAATKTEGVLIDDTMTLTAEFSGAAASGAKYQAVFNSAVKAAQNGSDTKYDQDSDVLVSEPVNASESDAGMLTLRFKRLVAVNKVALKGLDAGSMLGDVVIEATDGQNLVGTYSVKDAAFTDMASSLVINQGSSVVESGVAEAYFITLPVEATTLKVSAVTLDDDLNFAAAYEKIFAKTIDFQRGDLTSFGVQMNAKPAETFDLTVVGDVQASADRISWDRALVSVVGDKKSATQDCNYYYPGADKKSTRFYNGGTLTITPKYGVEIGMIEFTATETKYATALVESTWTNAKASANGTTVTVVPTDKTKAVSVGITATTGHSEIKVTFGEASVVAVTGVSLDQSELTMNVGETSTLTATVAPSDAFNKDVTWSSSDEAIATVAADGKVTAVAEGTATITATSAEGNYTATCAVTVLAGPVATDYSDVYSSNVTITGSKKVKIGTSEYSALQVGTSSAKGSVTFKVPANTTRLCLHVVGWNGEGEKTHTISTSVGTITPNSITTTADSGATGNSSPFSLSKTSYSSSDYYYEFELSGVTSQATITIANSAKKSRGIYFGINAE